MKKLYTGSVILAITIASIAAIHWLPLGRISEPIVGFSEPLVTIPLSEQPITQTFTATGQSIAGFVLYSPDEQVHAPSIQVTLKNKEGKVIGHGRGISNRFKHGHSAININTTWIKPSVKEKISIEITSLDNKSRLVATEDKEYTLGQVKTPESTTAKNLSFGIIYATPLSSSTKQGSYLGLAVGLGLILIHVISNYPTNRKYAWYLSTLVMIGASLAVSIPLIWSTGTHGISDWDYRLSVNHIYRQTILQYHELPAWNPYMCGGAAALGDPEFSVFTPAFLSILMFGPPVGYKVALVIGFIVTSLGTLALGKRIGLSPLGSAVAALIFTFNGAIILKVIEGHVTILFAYMWLPWVLWSYLAALRSSHKIRFIYILACSLFLVCMLTSGGIYILSYVLPLLVLLPLFTRRPRKAALITLTSMSLFIGLGAFQLLPTLDWLRQFPDPAYVNSTSTITHVIDVFFERHPHGSYILPHQLAGWHEYGAYIGYISMFLGLLGTTQVRRHTLTLALIIFIPITILVASSGPSLAPIFDKIPFIPRSNISRLALLSASMIALLAGQGLTKLQQHKLPTGIILLIVLVLPLDLFSYAYPSLEKTFSLPSVATPVTPAPYPIAHTHRTFTIRSAGQDYERSYGYTKAGYGTFTFCTVIGPAANVALYEDSPTKPFAYRLDTQEAVKVTNWTPNHFQLSYQIINPDTIRLNSNYARGWHSSLGQVKNRDGQLEVEAVPGTHTITLSYKPPGARVGGIISLLTVLLIMGILWRLYTASSPRLYSQYAKKDKNRLEKVI